MQIEKTRVSVYRIRFPKTFDEKGSLSELVDKDALESLNKDCESLEQQCVVHEGTVKRRRMLIVIGQFVTKDPPWLPKLKSFLTHENELELQTVQPAGLFLIKAKTGRYAWALTFGRGKSLLPSAYIEANFGRKFTLINADRRSIRSLTVTSMGQKILKGQLTYPDSNHYWNFPVEPMTDVVERVQGPVDIGGAVENTSGVHSLNVPIRLLEEYLIEDLDQLESAAKSDGTGTLLAQQSIAHVIDYKRAATLSKKVNTQLHRYLFSRNGAKDDFEVSVNWPTEEIGLMLDASTFKAIGYHDKALPADFTPEWEGPPTLDDLLKVVAFELLYIRPPKIEKLHPYTPSSENLADFRMPLKSINEIVKSGRPLDETLTKLKVSAKDSDGKESRFPFLDFLSFEITHNGTKYLSLGREWYSYSGDIRDDFERIFTDVVAPQASTLRQISAANPLKDFFHPWGSENEEDYNKDLADRHKPHTLLLDRGDFSAKNSVNDGRGTKFEPADVITDRGHLIHVKRFDGSAVISHLCMQAANSAVGIIRHTEARDSFWEGVQKRSQERSQELKNTNFKDKSIFNRDHMTVVIAIAGKGKSSIEDLPFLSLMAIARLGTILRKEGVKFEVWFIPS